MEKVVFIRLDSQKSYRGDDIEQLNKEMDKGWEWSEYKQMKNGEVMFILEKECQYERSLCIFR